MKVVVVHNRYRSAFPSGENRVVESEISLLADAGVEVISMIEDSDSLRSSPLTAANAAMGPILSPGGVRRLGKLIRDHRPDVVHLHNVFPLVSPWTVRTSKRAGIPVVQTVHNYRHTCVGGMHLRNDRVCDDCLLHRLPWPAVRHGCYRDSKGQSMLMAAGQVAHRSTWRLVNRFLITSPHMRERLDGLGIDGERIEWRATFAEDLGQDVLSLQGPLLFVGRLEYAKGIQLLLDAWTPNVAARWGKLVIAGNGPLATLVRDRSAADPSVEWHGALDGKAIRNLMRASRLVAVPSLWYEGFPRVAAEAMSVGRPLLFWEGAGVSRIADSNAAWALPDDPRAWAHHLTTLSDEDLQVRGGAARRFYEEHCSPTVAVEQLLRTYSTVIREEATG